MAISHVPAQETGKKNGKEKHNEGKMGGGGREREERRERGGRREREREKRKRKEGGEEKKKKKNTPPLPLNMGRDPAYKPHFRGWQNQNCPRSARGAPELGAHGNAQCGQFAPSADSLPPRKIPLWSPKVAVFWVHGRTAPPVPTLKNRGPESTYRHDSVC